MPTPTSWLDERAEDADVRPGGGPGDHRRSGEAAGTSSDISYIYLFKDYEAPPLVGDESRDRWPESCLGLGLQ